MTGRASAVGAFLALSFALVIAIGACGEVDHPACYPGDYLGCLCSGDVRGFATCNDGAYGACVCDGRTPGLDGSADAIAVESGAADAGKKGFLDNCTKNEDCDAGLFCKDFPAKGTFCSKSCTTSTAATDCPPPSTGCNKDGVCKAP